MMGRLGRFVGVGLLTTGLSYLIFMGALRVGLGYVAAAIASWAGPMAVSYLLNRRFTFRIAGFAGPPTEMAAFLAGNLLQMLLAVSDYAVLMGWLKLPPSVAFVISTAITATFGFIFMRWITFRPRLGRKSSS